MNSPVRAPAECQCQCRSPCVRPSKSAVHEYARCGIRPVDQRKVGKDVTVPLQEEEEEEEDSVLQNKAHDGDARRRMPTYSMNRLSGGEEEGDKIVLDPAVVSLAICSTQRELQDTPPTSDALRVARILSDMSPRRRPTPSSRPTTRKRALSPATVANAERVHGQNQNQNQDDEAARQLLRAWTVASPSPQRKKIRTTLMEGSDGRPLASGDVASGVARRLFHVSKSTGAETDAEKIGKTATETTTPPAPVPTTTLLPPLTSGTFHPAPASVPAHSQTPAPASGPVAKQSPSANANVGVTLLPSLEKLLSKSHLLPSGLLPLLERVVQEGLAGLSGERRGASELAEWVRIGERFNTNTNTSAGAGRDGAVSGSQLQSNARGVRRVGLGGGEERRKGKGEGKILSAQEERIKNMFVYEFE